MLTMRALPLALPLALILLPLTAGPAHAQAQPAAGDGAVRARVAALLSGYEDVPSEAEWAAIGPDAEPVLLEIAGDAKADLLRRARALSSLAHFPTPKVRARLEAWMADAALASLLRRKAALALAVGFGAEAEAALKAAAEDPDERLRDVARRALLKVPGPAPTP